MKGFFNAVKGKRIAVVGSGDTANCVMEYILPLVYPNYYYDFFREGEELPRSIHWIGQSAENIQDYFFNNKSRYCHSGGIIEFFWDEETPFELSTEIWKKTKKLITCYPKKLDSIKHSDSELVLSLNDQTIEVDLVINCTGRKNLFIEPWLKRDLLPIEGDITFYGGQWVEEIERFVSTPKTLKNKKLAYQLTNKKIYLMGAACPLNDLIDDDEAKNGSLRYQEERLSLTNSKWSLEHTLPRTEAFAKSQARLFEKN